jgi:hypothetical protein
MAGDDGPGTPTPTEVQRQRAEWDRLLLDIEQRTAQLQRERWDGAMREYERRVAIVCASAAVLLLAAGAALGALLVRTLS